MAYKTLAQTKTHLAEALEYCKAHCIDTHTPRDTEKEEAAKQNYQDAHDDLVAELDKLPTAANNLSRFIMAHYTNIAVTGNLFIYNYRAIFALTLFDAICDTTIPSFFSGLIETKYVEPWLGFYNQAIEDQDRYKPYIDTFYEPVNDFAFRCMFAPVAPQPGGSDMNPDKYYQHIYLDCGAYDVIKCYELNIYTRDDEPTPTPDPEPDTPDNPDEPTPEPEPEEPIEDSEEPEEDNP